jgi:hypothetical protein
LRKSRVALTVLSALLITILTAGFLPVSAQTTTTASEVSVDSPSGLTPRNHQNEPAVAVDAHNPNVLVAGSNDYIDQPPCPRELAQQAGTCDAFTARVGISGVYFSFDRGRHWMQPTYSGWTARDCSPTTTECPGHLGPIGTLPWYFESNLISDGDPAVTIGPRPVNGRFSWANGSRVYYANLTAAFNPATSPFRGQEAVAVSRLDNPTPERVARKSSWMRPVIATTRGGTTAFADKEQIWADNASSSRFFGRVYICSPQFRSPNFVAAPLMMAVSRNGGSTWSVRQVSRAANIGAVHWGQSGCTVRTDSRGVVYVMYEEFQNPAHVGLPTHGAHMLIKSFDGGVHWTRPRLLFRVTDPCFFIDPVYGRCVMDGYAGARTDLSAAPSIDIANGAPTGAGATNLIVDAWSDASAGLNHEHTLLTWSRNGGTTWSRTRVVSAAGDRPLYSAPAVSPTGNRVYVVYEAVRSPWRGTNMSLPRPYHGVFRSAAFGAGGPSGWTTLYNGPLGDLRGTYPGHDIYQERVGDYVYAAASRTYGVGVWTDARNAAVCQAVQQYRQASLAAGELALPAPWPLADCPAGFGNTDIWSATTG